MGEEFNNYIKRIPKISLTQLNSSASFLNRVESKYIFPKKNLNKILKKLEKDFYILNIDEKSIFNYDSVYMDTAEYNFYNEHQSEKKNRTKIRTRLYKDSNLAFFEYKQKKGKGTKKFRYEFPSKEHGTMTKGKTRFFEGVYMSFYGKLPKKISPSLRTNYNRLTLVSKDSEERITIDFNIKLKDLRNKNSKEACLKNTVILETKSRAIDCPSHKIIESFGLEKSSHCSKYCLGLIYNKLGLEPGIFHETMKKIEKIEKK